MKKKIEKSTLKFALVCLSAFAVLGLLFMLKRRKNGQKNTIKNIMKNGVYNNSRSLAAINHNPTNIVKTKNRWSGEIDTPEAIKKEGRSERFKAFESDYYGILAAYNNLKSYFNSGYNTLRKIITRWAPPTENNTDNYIVSMAKKMGVGVDDILDPKKHAFSLIREIAKIESGFSGDEIILAVVSNH